MGLSRNELETIMNFNKAANIADIFMYDKSQQKHIDKKPGIEPIEDNGFSGRSCWFFIYAQSIFGHSKRPNIDLAVM